MVSTTGAATRPYNHASLFGCQNIWTPWQFASFKHFSFMPTNVHLSAQVVLEAQPSKW
jgi:hypothetical protein